MNSHNALGMLRAVIVGVVVAIVVLVTSGCATAPRTPPRFVAPDTTPIRKAIEQTQSHISTAQDKAAALEKECASKSAGWQKAYNALRDELNQAYLSAKTAEDARAKAQTEGEKQAGVANWYADAYTKDQAEIKATQESRHKYVLLCWKLGAALALAAAWIFRKPLMMALGGLGGI
jgi:hypothetical protein